MKTPIKQTIYLPVKVEDELPSETENSKVAILHKERGFDFAYYMHKWKSFDHFKQGLSYKQSDITHWLKPQEGYFFTPDQLNEYTQNVIKQALEEAAEKYVRNESDAALRLISKYSFKDGAKWQAERMYSEEEVLALLEKGYHSHYNSLSIEEWFKQFKKNNGK